MKLVRENMELLNIFTPDSDDPISDMGLDKKSIEKWLKEHEIIDYIMLGNREINVFTSVDLSNLHLNKIPDNIKFNHITGGFYINKNNLTSLRGCPYSVSGSFLISTNKLTSLKYSPLIVQESFAASHNLLESLEGIPEIIGSSIILTSNNLKTLEHIPKVIKGHFHIQDNPIETLEFFPDKIEGDVYFTRSEIVNFETLTKRCKIYGAITEYKK